MTLYDVIDGDGRRLNERPLSYQSAELFALDVMIDSSTNANVVPSVRQEDSPKRLSWLVVLGVVAAVVLGAVVVGCL